MNITPETIGLIASGLSLLFAILALIQARKAKAYQEKALKLYQRRMQQVWSLPQITRIIAPSGTHNWEDSNSDYEILYPPPENE